MPKPTKRELTDALATALDDQIWMSGSSSFSPGGEAHEGWEKVRERLFRNLDLLKQAQDA